jgi:acyl-CoA thioester hydrolase
MVTLAVRAEHDTLMPPTGGPMATEPCSHVTVTRLTVRPADMDADRNVNNAVYFEYFHQSRLEHLARLGVWRPRGSQDDNLFALAENTCRYLAPSFYGDVLSIWTATHAVGSSSFQLVYRIWRKSDGALIAAAHSVQVWLDGSRQPTSLPPPVREGLTASLCTDLPKMPSRD